MKLERMKPGMKLYDVARQRMGNTLARTTTVFVVQIIEVDLDEELVRASWNGNPPKAYHRGRAERWRSSKPVMVKSGFGQRVASRAELKAMKSAQEQAK
jgi:hypothetical protein